MKNLVFVTHGLSLNGIEIFVSNVLEYLNKEKYNISVLLAIDEDTTAILEERVKSYGVNVIHICDLDSISKKMHFFKTLYLLFKENKYDIVHANMDLLNGIVVTIAKLAGVPIRVSHAHTTHSKYRTNVVKVIVQKVYHEIMRILMTRFSTNCLACSYEAGEYFYGKIKPQFIYNGVDTEKFSQRNCSEQTHKQIVTVARCTDVKNPFFAVEVIAKLKKIRNDFIYKWVGTGDLLEAAKQKANELNASDVVEFTGPRTDIPQILSNSKVFFMPSRFEGLSISLVEAQFAGLNCVMSNNITELSNLGRTTFVSLDESAEHWAKIISDNLDKPTPPLDEERAKLFDIKHTVKQLEEIYDK